MFPQTTPDEHPPTPPPCRWPALPRQVSARLAALLLCCALSLLPCRAHPHGRLCPTPLVLVCRKYKVHLNILWPSKWTVNVPPYWYRFSSRQEDEHLSMPLPKERRCSRTHVQTLRTAGRFDTSSSLSAKRVPPRTPKFEVSIGILKASGKYCRWRSTVLVTQTPHFINSMKPIRNGYCNFFPWEIELMRRARHTEDDTCETYSPRKTN